MMSVEHFVHFIHILKKLLRDLCTRFHIRVYVKTKISLLLFLSFSLSLFLYLHWSCTQNCKVFIASLSQTPFYKKKTYTAEDLIHHFHRRCSYNHCTAYQDAHVSLASHICLFFFTIPIHRQQDDSAETIRYRSTSTIISSLSTLVYQTMPYFMYQPMSHSVRRIPRHSLHARTRAH